MILGRDRQPNPRSGVAAAALGARRGGRADKDRKYDIFRTLMRTRMVPLPWEHVGALNLVEVELIEHTEVVQAWKAYLENLAQPVPSYNDDIYNRSRQDRDALLTSLLDKIAQALDIKISQLDILQGNYVPRGWSDDNQEQRCLGAVSCRSFMATLPSPFAYSRHHLAVRPFPHRLILTEVATVSRRAAQNRTPAQPIADSRSLRNGCREAAWGGCRVPRPTSATARGRPKRPKRVSIGRM